MAVADSFAHGRFLSVDPLIPIFYGLLASPLVHLGISAEAACRTVSLVSSTLLIAPVYALARDLFGRRSARVAALTCALWPWLADYASQVALEALAVTLWFTAVWTLGRSIRRGGWWIVGSVLAFFALHLTRAEGIVLLLAAPVAALVLTEPGERRRQLMQIAAFVVLALVLLTAYSSYMRAVVGEATVSHRAGFVVEQFNFHNIVKAAVTHIYEKIPIMLGPVLLVFLGVGLLHKGSAPRDHRLELVVLFYAGLQCALAASVPPAAPRYVMATIIALSLWSARGMAIITEQWQQRWYKVVPVGAMVCSMLFITAISVVGEHSDSRPREPREYKIVGTWMKENLEPGLIMTRKPQVGYYAGMSTAGPATTDTLDELIQRGEKWEPAIW